MAFDFPGTDFDNPSKVQALLGSFWNRLYGDRDLLRRFCLGLGMLHKQTLQQIGEFQVAASRLTVSPVSVRLWDHLVLAAADEQTYPHVVGEPGQTIGDGSVVGGVAGDPACWPLPDNLQDLPILLGRLTTPDLDGPNAAASEGATLIHGTDYLVDSVRRLLVFDRQPLADGRLRRFLDPSTGLVSAASLWPFSVSYASSAAQDRYGAAVGLSGDPSEPFTRLINAAWDALVSGATRSVLQRAMSAITGIRLAEASETVETVFTDRNGLVIATNLHIYRFPATSQALVGPGDVVVPGQALVGSLRIFEFTSGQAPSAADLPSVTIPQEMLLGNYGALTFANSDTSLIVQTDGGGNTQVSFALGGSPAGIAQFWADVHDRGLAAGKTLAQYLDIRPNPTGQPTAASLPTKINPLVFASQNLLRNAVVLAIIAADVQDDTSVALGLDWLWGINLCKPAGCAVITQMV